MDGVWRWQYHLLNVQDELLKRTHSTQSTHKQRTRPFWLMMMISLIDARRSICGRTHTLTFTQNTLCVCFNDNAAYSWVHVCTIYCNAAVFSNTGISVFLVLISTPSTHWLTRFRGTLLLSVYPSMGPFILGPSQSFVSYHICISVLAWFK